MSQTLTQTMSSLTFADNPKSRVPTLLHLPINNQFRNFGSSVHVCYRRSDDEKTFYFETKMDRIHIYDTLCYDVPDDAWVIDNDFYAIGVRVNKLVSNPIGGGYDYA